MVIYPTCTSNPLAERGLVFWYGRNLEGCELDKKHTLFFCVTPCSVADMHQCVGGTCCFHLWGRRILCLKMGQQVLPKPTTLHGVIPQKTVLIIVTAMRMFHFTVLSSFDILLLLCLAYLQ
jgi:hypothetical protein